MTQPAPAASPNGTPPNEFDVRAFTRDAQGSWRSEIDVSSFAEHPLDADTLRLLRLMVRFESATMEHLRNLLVTATHKDARVTAFLVTWAFEKFWIADALDAVLQAHGLKRTRETEEGPKRHTLVEAAERRGAISRAFSAIRQGVSVVAAHMTSGLVDDWILREAYIRMIEANDDAVLTGTVERVLSIKKRHEEFFLDEAIRRLSESPRAVKETRAALTQAAWPLGAVERAAAERTFFEAYVFGGAEGAARASSVGDRVARLPGLDSALGATTARKLTP